MQKDQKELVRWLLDNGYKFKRHAKGSHEIYSNGTHSVSVAHRGIEVVNQKIKREVRANAQQNLCDGKSEIKRRGY